MVVVDANISNLFNNFVTQVSPTGDATFVGLILLVCFVYVCWTWGLTLISTVILGFLALAILHMAFGGIFTIIYLVSSAMIGLMIALIFVTRLTKYT